MTKQRRTLVFDLTDVAHDSVGSDNKYDGSWVHFQKFIQNIKEFIPENDQSTTSPVHDSYFSLLLKSKLLDLSDLFDIVIFDPHLSFTVMFSEPEDATNYLAKPQVQ